MAPAPILTVPSVLGLTFDEADRVAAAAGFTLATLEEQTAGPITVQLPAAEAEAEKGWTRILVWFSPADEGETPA